MSGVYIRGMEMPTGCPYCLLSHWECNEFMGCEAVIGKGRAVLTDKEYAESPAASRPDWCPLIPVPDHGRLVDADAAMEAVEMDDRSTVIEVMHIKELLCDAPTIIPASKEADDVG